MPLTDAMLDIKCVDGGTMGYNYNCAGTTVKIEYYSANDCSTDVSAKCDLSLENLMTGMATTDCHVPFAFGECVVIMDLAGVVVAMKHTGTCPAEDEPVLDQANPGHCVQCDARMRRHLLFGSLPCCP